MKKIIEGSKAVALAVRLCRPAVVCVYPITPQTHIVEDLAKFKADGEANYEYIRAESEFAAASVVAGASATGVRTYIATCSQGILLMNEVLYAIAGMRLPVVLTCANRAVSAPINIWNDQQDIMSIRDSGWIILFAETNQEAVDLHIAAYRIAEKTSLPVTVNMDGFTLTHTFEPVDIPSQELADKLLPAYKPRLGTYLDIANPKSLGCFATPADYQEIRQELHEDLDNSAVAIKQSLNMARRVLKRGSGGLIEKYRMQGAETAFIAMGSVAGTIKEGVDALRKKGVAAGMIKVTSFRPFPRKEMEGALKGIKWAAVLDKSISLGREGILATDIKSEMLGKKAMPKIQSFIAGLGGKDFCSSHLDKIIKELKKASNNTVFIS